MWGKKKKNDFKADFWKWGERNFININHFDGEACLFLSFHSKFSPSMEIALLLLWMSWSLSNHFFKNQPRFSIKRDFIHSGSLNAWNYQDCSSFSTGGTCIRLAQQKHIKLQSKMWLSHNRKHFVLRMKMELAADFHFKESLVLNPRHPDKYPASHFLQADFKNTHLQFLFGEGEKINHLNNSFRPILIFTLWQ